MNKKRILHIHGGMNMGGTESVIMNLYRNIDRNRFEFYFTTMTKESCAYDNEIIALGGNIIYINPKYKVGFLKHFKELYTLFKSENYDVIHSHMNFHGGIVALIGKISGCKKIVCHAHNTKDDGVGLKRKFEILILRKFIRIFSDELVACGREAGEFVFGKNAKYTLLNNAVDLKRFNPKVTDDILKLKKEYCLENKLILGHVGRFMEQKNHKFIIKIIEKLSKKNSDFIFVFIGDGELKSEFIKEIKEKRLDKYVLTLGLRDDVEKWLKVFDIMVFPSLHEGLPVTLIEAQATGLKCIISDTISIDTDMGLGLVEFIGIDSGKEDEWAERILNTRKERVSNEEKIINAMDKKGYLLSGIIKKISKIYEGE